jgi:hypothetical protein
MDERLGVPRFDYYITERWNASMEETRPYQHLLEYRDPSSNLRIGTDGEMKWGHYEDNTKPNLHSWPMAAYEAGRRFVYSREGETGRPPDHIFSTLPSRITPDGYMFWYKGSKLHREDDLPAMVRLDMTSYQKNPESKVTIAELGWYQDGQLHRDGDKPAYVCFTTSNATWYRCGHEFRASGYSSMRHGAQYMYSVLPEDCLKVDVERDFTWYSCTLKRLGLFTKRYTDYTPIVKTNHKILRKLRCCKSQGFCYFKVKVTTYWVKSDIHPKYYAPDLKEVLHREDGPAIEYERVRGDCGTLPKDVWVVAGSYAKGRLLEEARKAAKAKNARSIVG